MVTYRVLFYATIACLANSCLVAVADNDSPDTRETEDFPVSPYKILARPGPGVGFDFLPVQARGLNFYIGGPPGAYCPQQASDCPSGKETLFAGLGSLMVPVPGGQQIFVRVDGSLGFTQAHSMRIPTGAIVGGSLTYTKDDGEPFGTLGTTAFDATGFMACLVDDGAGSANFQVYAAISNATSPDGKPVKCIKFAAMTYEKIKPDEGAWQYI